MGSSRARVKSRLRYGMYSRIAGTGVVSAPAGSQMRAARRQPSDIGIQQFSITRTALGNRLMIFIEAPPALQLYWILLASWNQSSLNKSFRSLPSYRRKPVSRLFEIPGFRVGPRLSPGLPGMTTEFCCEFWDRT